MRELIIPPAAASDPDSIEIIRAWIADGSQWISLFPNLYKDEEIEEESAWGFVLADTMRHLANAIAQDSESKRPDDVLDRIRRALEQELDEPTSSVRGGYVKYGAA